jgi:hypothetical protein
MRRKAAPAARKRRDPLVSESTQTAAIFIAYDKINTIAEGVFSRQCSIVELEKRQDVIAGAATGADIHRRSGTIAFNCAGASAWGWDRSLWLPRWLCLFFALCIKISDYLGTFGMVFAPTLIALKKMIFFPRQD